MQLGAPKIGLKPVGTTERAPPLRLDMTEHVLPGELFNRSPGNDARAEPSTLSSLEDKSWPKELEVY